MSGSDSQARGPVGMLVGGGDLPLEIARSILRSGRPVHVVGIAGEADQNWSGIPHTTVNWGAIGGMLAALKGAGCRELVIVGRVRRPDPFKIRPDLGFFAALPRVIQLVTAGGDDSLLRRCLRFFEDHDLAVRGPADLAPELVARAGAIGTLSPDETALKDIALGFDVVRTLGRFDIGQAVAVADGRVIAIEGAEGTDRLIGRLESGCGAILVKCPKPGQELRIDMPAIGPRTVELAAGKGLRGIAVEAGSVLVAHREEVARLAQAAGVFVAGSSCPALPDRVAAGHAPAIRQVGSRRLTGSDVRDAGLAGEIVAALRPYARQVAVLVARRHVLAVGVGESVPGFLARATGLKQWGDKGWWRRGVLGVSEPAQLDPRGIEKAAAARLAGIVVGSDVAGGEEESLAARCDSLGLSLAAATAARGKAGA